MKPNNLNRNNILIAVGAILLIGAVVYYFFSRDTSSPDLLASVPAGEVSGVEGDLLTTLRELKSLKLDDSIFADNVFLRLTDFSQPLTPQPIGRSNPFAPLGTDISTPSSQASASTTKATR